MIRPLKQPTRLGHQSFRAEDTTFVTATFSPSPGTPSAGTQSEPALPAATMSPDPADRSAHAHPFSTRCHRPDSQALDPYAQLRQDFSTSRHKLDHTRAGPRAPPRAVSHPTHRVDT